MKDEFVFNELDVKFITSTAIMVKDIVGHTIYAYLKDAEGSKQAVFATNVLMNAVGNTLMDLSAKNCFLINCTNFAKDWDSYIKQVTKQLDQKKKEAH